MYPANRKIRAAAILASGLVVAGCGGIGGSDRSNSAEGVFIGATDSNRTITMLVTSTGPYFAFYSAVGNPQVIAGTLQGTAIWSANEVSSADTVDVNLEGAGTTTATIAGNYITAGSLNVTEANPTLNKVTTIATLYSPAYEGHGDVTRLVGTYTGTLAGSTGSETATLTLAADGSVSGSGTSGCVYAGVVAPLLKGNAYSFGLTSGGASCRVGNMTIAGAALIDPTTKRLYAAGVQGARTDGLVFIGSKS